MGNETCFFLDFSLLDLRRFKRHDKFAKSLEAKTILPNRIYNSIGVLTICVSAPNQFNGRRIKQKQFIFDQAQKNVIDTCNTATE